MSLLAPRNAEVFKPVGQDETSITLQWSEVENISIYQLKYSGKEIEVTATQHRILGLTAGSKYDFTLFAVFEGVRSSGVSIAAVTGKRSSDCRPERTKWKDI